MGTPGTYRFSGPYKTVNMTPEQQQRQDLQVEWLHAALKAQHSRLAPEARKLDPASLSIPTPR